MSTFPGRFVVFEGGEGCGKSTQLRRLAERLRADQVPVLETREPGGTPRAERLRDFVLSDEAVGLPDRAEFLVFAAARADHVHTVIRPALADGRVVLCDRFSGSSVAYQGRGRGLGEADVQWVSRWASGGLQPDLTLVLDVAPETGLARAKDRNHMEERDLDFHRRVRHSFLAQAAQDPSHVVIPATGEIDEIAETVHRVVNARLGLRSEEAR